MAGLCRTFACAGMLLVAAIGCRTPQPELKPAKQPEVLTQPPSEARFNSSQYPDMAYRDMHDRFRKPAENSSNPILPARGLGGSMGPGGNMGGLRP